MTPKTPFPDPLAPPEAHVAPRVGQTVTLGKASFPRPSRRRPKVITGAPSPRPRGATGDQGWYLTAFDADDSQVAQISLPNLDGAGIRTLLRLDADAEVDLSYPVNSELVAALAGTTRRSGWAPDPRLRWLLECRRSSA